MTFQGGFCAGQNCIQHDYYNFSHENHTEIFVDIMQLEFIGLINWSSTGITTANASFSFPILGVIFISVLAKKRRKR